jgi:hypothetical protein
VIARVTTTSAPPPRVTTTTAASLARATTTTAALPRVTTTTTAAQLARVTTTTVSSPRTTSTLTVALREVPPPPVHPTPSATTPPPVPQGITSQEVEGLLQSYAAAWQRHDVDTLRSIGQVNDEAQAAALRDYFTRVQDLEVEVRLLETRERGERRTVRFTRLDRFRDPAGRVVTKETPPIEKEVVRTGSRLRFASPR